MGKSKWQALRQWLKTIPGAVRAVRFARSWLDPHESTLRQIRTQLPGQLLQPSMVTEPDRYPEFFGFVAGQLADVAAPRILSFGCSSGEEVFSLRARIPSAEIVGLDINPRALAACEQRLASGPPDQGIRFACKGSAAGEPDASFDAIFCMAVLRHGELQASRPQQCDALLAFATAERTVSELARCLKPGGLLAIWNCHFRFVDMAAAAQFDVAYSSAEGAWANQPLYGRDNSLLPRALYCEAIFRKHIG